MVRLKKIFLIYFMLITAILSAQTALQKGLSYIQQNQPDKAIAILFKETSQENANPKAYLYLGVACIQAGQYSDAITWLTKGKSIDYTDKHLYAYNLGNAYFMQNLLEKARDAYTESINIKPFYGPALLNRANTNMKMEKYDDALKDYKDYLIASPSSTQRGAVQRIVSLLETEKLEAELIKLKAEAEAQAALQREQELLDSVNNSLTSADDAESISVGSEDTIDYSSEEENLE